MIGTGGKLLESAGLKPYHTVEEMAVIGFQEVLKRYRHFKGIYDNMVQTLDRERPDAVLLVDYAGFNLKFAAEAKQRGIKVIFYIAPQVWAWKKKRIEKIKAYVDHLIVLFPFEVDFFNAENMESTCFGHPLLDIVKPDVEKKSFFEQHKLDLNQKVVSLLPGSRGNEVRNHLPILLQTALILKKEYKQIQFVYPLASTVKKKDILPYLAEVDLAVRVVEGDTYNAVAHSDFAIVASGTATLETAILQTPLIIFYRVTAATFFIGRYLLGIKSVGLPNIVAGEDLVPELIQHNSSPEDLALRVKSYLESPTKYDALKKGISQVKGKLGEHGAYKKTAEYINQLLG